MQYLSLTKYIIIVLAAYTSSFIVDKIFIYNKYIKQFYYNRRIFPAVRIWDSSYEKLLYNEVFTFIETLIITLLYIATYWIIPVTHIGKSFIFIFSFFTIAIAVKSKFILVATTYPVSLFVLDISRMFLSYLVQAIVLHFMYKPI